MKTKVLKSVKHATLLLFLLLIGYSCSDDVVGLQSKVIPITIKERDWTWDNDAGRYEVIVDLPEMSNYIYEKGTLNGYVFIGQQGVNEVQKALPYVHTYFEGVDDDGFDIKYTETISCDFMYGTPSTVAFYIQASDLFRNDDILSDYNFKIVLNY